MHAKNGVPAEKVQEAGPSNRDGVPADKAGPSRGGYTGPGIGIWVRTGDGRVKAETIWPWTFKSEDELLAIEICPGEDLEHRLRLC